MVKVQRSLEVQKQRGGQFKAPKKKFVLEEDWDDGKDGKKDPSKLTTEKVLSIERKGWWKTLGQKGHFDYEEFTTGSNYQRRTRKRLSGEGSYRSDVKCYDWVDGSGVERERSDLCAGTYFTLCRNC